MAIALEASGRADLQADADGDTLRSELQSAAADYGKVLIRWRPDDTLSARRRQLATLGALDAVIADAGTQLLLELLIVNDASNAAGAEAIRVWQEVRMPRAQVDAADEILGSGLVPALWKVEGHSDMNAGAAETRHAIGERFLAVVDAFCSMAGTLTPVAPDWAPTKPAD